jgi:hypothetical protein
VLWTPHTIYQILPATSHSQDLPTTNACLNKYPRITLLKSSPPQESRTLLHGHSCDFKLILKLKKLKYQNHHVDDLRTVEAIHRRVRSSIHLKIRHEYASLLHKLLWTLLSSYMKSFTTTAYDVQHTRSPHFPKPTPSNHFWVPAHKSRTLYTYNHISSPQRQHSEFHSWRLCQHTQVVQWHLSHDTNFTNFSVNSKPAVSLSCIGYNSNTTEELSALHPIFQSGKCAFKFICPKYVQAYLPPAQSPHSPKQTTQ